MIEGYRYLQDRCVQELHGTDPLIERVFMSGNLVHGIRHLDAVKSLLTEGIKGGSLVYSTRNFISFAILGDEDAHERYARAVHYGPRPEREAGISIIVSKEKLHKAFPRQLFAVGRDFQDQQFLRLKARSTYGFPYKGYKIGAVENGEVRLFPKILKHDQLVVTPEFYVGIVAADSAIDRIRDVTKGAGISNLPIFSPSINYLGHVLSQ